MEFHPKLLGSCRLYGSIHFIGHYFLEHAFYISDALFMPFSFPFSLFAPSRETFPGLGRFFTWLARNVFPRAMAD